MGKLNNTLFISHNKQLHFVYIKNKSYGLYVYIPSAGRLPLMNEIQYDLRTILDPFLDEQELYTFIFYFFI
ncbi:hypothetical protein Hanom_Chr12g01067391 [Helianthus anomalus]